MPLPVNHKDIEEIAVPTPIKPDVLTNLWKLFFKAGMNPRCELVFPFNGTKEDAIKRGREFCLRVNYKFIHVEPFLVDLDESEKKFLVR